MIGRAEREPRTAGQPARGRHRYPALAAVLLAAALAGAGCAERGGPGYPAARPGPFTPVPSGTSATTGGPGATAGPGAPGSGLPTGGPQALHAARYAFPVAGAARYVRDHHDYPATDIMAGCGSPVRAVTDGVVLEVSLVDRYSVEVNDGATRGGLSVSLLGDDGVRYYGSHLSLVAPGIRAGTRVTAGQYLGKVGETGDASACHLHFGISPPCAGTGDWWVRRGVVWPWPFLDSWRVGPQRSPAPEVSAWRASHGCPRTAPPGA